jgi:hypothetical protein
MHLAHRGLSATRERAPVSESAPLLTRHQRPGFRVLLFIFYFSYICFIFSTRYQNTIKHIHNITERIYIYKSTLFIYFARTYINITEYYTTFRVAFASSSMLLFAKDLVGRTRHPLVSGSDWPLLSRPQVAGP